MKKPLTLLLLLCVALCGCANVNLNLDPAQLPVQYATMKAIQQSSDISAEDVVAHVGTLKAVLERDPDMSLQQLAQQALAAGLAAGLSPADQLLLQTLISTVEVSLAEVNLVDDARRLKAVQVLGWVADAAKMSAGY